VIPSGLSVALTFPASHLLVLLYAMLDGTVFVFGA
jgi:hypothetical protein